MFPFIGLLLIVIVANCDAACTNNRADCYNLASYCKIPAYKTFMTTWCPKLCGFCDGGPNPPTPPTPPTAWPPVTNPPQGGCGNPQFANARVIAGTTAVRGSWPWQILMSYNGRAGCGGSLISPTWVVTAAHCVSGKEGNARAFSIRVGEHNRNMNEGSEQNHQVSRVITHPSYNKRTLNNDIALFKLSTPVRMSKYVQPVCLPSGEVRPGTQCYITGWGKTSHPGQMTSILQQAVLPVVSKNVCHRLNIRNIGVPVTDAMICGGSGGSSRKSGCHGDSGGPYVCRVGGRWELHGAVSHGSKTCSSSTSYTVFSKVVYFKSWIQQTMRRY